MSLVPRENTTLTATLSLMRLRLLPSAVVDVFAGIAVGGGLAGLPIGSVLRTALASACIYTAGMVLNDVADARRDRELAPSRAIPSGAVARSTAAVLGIALLAIGLAVVPWPAPGWIAALVVGLVLTYDFGCTRRPWLGAPVLGACRAGNLSLGIALTGTSLGSAGVIAILGCYGVYVGCAVAHGALEDREPSPAASATILVTACAAGFVAALFTPNWLYASAAAIPTCVAAARIKSQSAAFVPRRTGALLRGLSRFGFLVTLGYGAWGEAGLVFVLAYVLPLLIGKRRWS